MLDWNITLRINIKSYALFLEKEHSHRLYTSFNTKMLHFALIKGLKSNM